LVAGTVSATMSIISPFTEWWADRLPARRMGTIGALLIVSGFLLQSIQYLLVLFGKATAGVRCWRSAREALLFRQAAAVADALNRLHLNLRFLMRRNIGAGLGQQHERLRAVGEIESALKRCVLDATLRARTALDR